MVVTCSDLPDTDFSGLFKRMNALEDELNAANEGAGGSGRLFVHAKGRYVGKEQKM